MTIPPWTDEDILNEGRRVIEAEATGLATMAAHLDGSFCSAVRSIASCKGRVVMTALGKSGVIAKKVASTFASLGCPSVFVHPIEGMHGDLGMIVNHDLIVAISHSGNSDELVGFLSAACHRVDTTIAIVGNKAGRVAQHASIVLETKVASEACALGLAPTTSSTAALALGDGLAVAVSRLKGFQASQFATLHPAGALGDRLRTPVELMMREQYPWVSGDTSLREAIGPMTEAALGAVIVIDAATGRFGIVTDGDVRRAARHSASALDRRTADVMSSPPRSVPIGTPAVQALMEMERERLTSLVVTGTDGKPVGILHIHDVLRYGLQITAAPAKLQNRSR